MLFSPFEQAMLRISKRVEYGLVALQHLAKCGNMATVREIADQNGISYDLLAKIMQELKRDGMICSYQGVRGGYTLMLAPGQIPVTRVIEALEDDNSITECTSETECCSREAVCTIKTPMHHLQQQMDSLLRSVTVAQLL